MKVTIDGTVIEGTPEEIKEMMTLMGAEIPEKKAEEAEETDSFREGDRVKTLNDGEDGDIKAGEIGTIDWISDSMGKDGDPYYIFVETDDDSDYFRPQDLEKVTEEEPKFKVGDYIAPTSEAPYGITSAPKMKLGKVIGGGRDTGDDITVEIIEHVSGLKGETFSVESKYFRKVTEEEIAKYTVETVEETITHNGAEYTLVDRKAQAGDVVVFTENKSICFENDTPYGPVYIEPRDGLVVGEDGLNVYNGAWNRTESNVKVYETVETTPKYTEEKRKPREFKKGDIISYDSAKHGRKIVGEVESVDSGHIQFFTPGFGINSVNKNSTRVELIAPVEARVDGYDA